MLPGGNKSTVSERAGCAGAQSKAEMGLQDQIPAPEAIKLPRLEAAGCPTELRAAVLC